MTRETNLGPIAYNDPKDRTETKTRARAYTHSCYPIAYNNPGLIPELSLPHPCRDPVPDPQAGPVTGEADEADVAVRLEAASGARKTIWF